MCLSCRKIEVFIYCSQQGSVLITSLILLLVLTLLGLSSMQTSVMEEMMAGNAKDHHMAFQSAEAALRDGESRILAYIAEPIPSPTGATDVWVKNSPDVDTSNGTSWWCETGAGDAWWLVKGISYTKDLGYTTTPQSLVEIEDFVRDSLNVGQQMDESGKVYYRITARGRGGSNQALSMLRSAYAKRY